MRVVVRAKPPEQAPRLNVGAVRVRVPSRAMRVLDFDVECRPLHFYGEYVSKEITAIAWKFIGEPGDVACYLLGEVEPADMLRAFVHVYNQADMVTGHYILGFDLPLVQGALTEYQLPALGDKLTQDTKVHLLRRHGLSSSQENLGAMFDLQHPKVHMDQATWRAANRLQPAGLAKVRERVTGDVLQHIELRQKLLDLGYMTTPTIWRSNSDAPAYTP